MPVPFHFAYHVTDLDEARAFYTGALGAVEGRSTDTWVDFDFFGHQLSLHLGAPFANAPTGKVDPACRPSGGPADRFHPCPFGALQGRTGRTMDDVFPRSVWQPDRDQGFRRRKWCFCEGVRPGCCRSCLVWFLSRFFNEDGFSGPVSGL
jgi:catechol 2,3-dioxygenase-like lactoylglutathione lyase family enzyme